MLLFSCLCTLSVRPITCCLCCTIVRNIVVAVHVHVRVVCKTCCVTSLLPLTHLSPLMPVALLQSSTQSSCIFLLVVSALEGEQIPQPAAQQTSAVHQQLFGEHHHLIQVPQPLDDSQGLAGKRQSETSPQPQGDRVVLLLQVEQRKEALQR